MEFLEDHDIDTNELIQRQTTIYNTGLYAGGDVTLNGSAVGVGGSIAGVFKRGQATATAGQPAPATPPAPAPPANRGR
ncbi:hypothetical protein [Streptomyces sp. bgisy027]|uniref:hypothetical protein n=1 Tax=Streptomyces sp. bgisy027 TaxID=3413770 RepID=UPI003D71671E